MVQSNHMTYNGNFVSGSVNSSSKLETKCISQISGRAKDGQNVIKSNKISGHQEIG